MPISLTHLNEKHLILAYHYRSFDFHYPVHTLIGSKKTAFFPSISLLYLKPQVEQRAFNTTRVAPVATALNNC